MQQYIQALEEAAISDSHIAGRFAGLLKRMWVSGSQFEPPQNVDVVDERSCRYATCDSQLPEPLFVPTPDFNLFCPEFSSLESELVELGMGSLSYPV